MISDRFISLREQIRFQTLTFKSIQIRCWATLSELHLRSAPKKSGYFLKETTPIFSSVEHGELMFSASDTSEVRGLTASYFCFVARQSLEVSTNDWNHRELLCRNLKIHQTWKTWSVFSRGRDTKEKLKGADSLFFLSFHWKEKKQTWENWNIWNKSL